MNSIEGVVPSRKCLNQETAPKLATWAEANIREGLAIFALPTNHRKHARTTNMLERQSRELKRRTRVASLFPNEVSLLKLVTAVLVELSDEWEIGMRYLTCRNRLTSFMMVSPSVSADENWKMRKAEFCLPGDAIIDELRRARDTAGNTNPIPPDWEDTTVKDVTLQVITNLEKPGG